MKSIIAVVMTGWFLFSTLLNANAQELKSVTPYQIGITYLKTTSIIFPQAIVSVDRGSRDILAQKAKGVENILQVKAARDSFPETNLTVVTADGKLNSFIVNYSSNPSVLNISLSNTTKPATVSFSPENKNLAVIQKYARSVLESTERSRVLAAHNSGIEIRITGFFVHDDIIYCRVLLDNRANIGYDIDALRFFIRDQQKAKRTATQEIEVIPVYIENNTALIKAQQTQAIVFALPKFTIPDKKYLAIQAIEKNGGRHLEVHVKNRVLIRAKPLAL